MRFILCCAMVVAGLAATTLAADGEIKSAAIARPPYLQLATPDSVVIVWRTLGRSEPIVRYGSKPDALDQQAPAKEIVTRVSPDHQGDQDLPRLHSAPEDTWQYEARISGLDPETTYYYAVFDGDKRLAGGDETFRFATHPERGTSRPLRFWVVGDSGTGEKDQAMVHEAMVQYTTREARPLDMYLHVGDMAYGSGTDDQFQNYFFAMYEPTLRNTVCWAAMGNHEGHTSKGETGEGPYYDCYVLPTTAQAGGLASGTEAYYSFDYGRVHFICLDSHDLDRTRAGAMARWLKADLEKTRADWLIAFWHHPPYTKGSHDSDRESQLIEMRTHIMPILESGGVDLVLTGHSHIYERSMLMDGAYSTPTVAENVILDDGDGDPTGDGAYRKSAGLHPNEGTVQIVAGHGGARVSRKGTMPVMRKIVVEHGSVIVNVHEDTLTAIMLNKDGATRDLFSIVKSGQVTPQRIAHPWQAPAYTPTVAARPVPPVPQPTSLPSDATDLIAQHAEWEYLSGSQPTGDWTQFDFVAEGWKVGTAGFGYGDNDDSTVLPGMQDKYTAVYIRGEFEVESTARDGEIGLVINYDDAFIAYVNGKEVLRVGVGQGSGKDAKQIDGHEAGGYAYFPLRDVARLLRADENVLAIEGHNSGADSSDFTLDPYLVISKKAAGP